VTAKPPHIPRIAFLPESAPFTPAQRLWLDGFFAGLLTQALELQAPPVQKPPLTILFASQTGTAESLAKKLAKAAKARGFAAKAVELGTLDLAGVAALGQVAVIASTHGEGDPPDGAMAFAQTMKAAQGTPLAGLSYAVLALGDSNYAKFCCFGADVDEGFARLGATRLMERMECDGDTETPFKTFRESFMKTVDTTAPATAQTPEAPGLDADEEEEGETWPHKRPFPATLLYKVNLNGPKSDKETRHVEIAIDDAQLPYEPGDALGVIPVNTPETVAAVLAASRLDADAPVEVDSATLSLEEALTRCLEIGKLTQPTVIKFQAFAQSALLERLLEPDNVDERNALSVGP
jgi:sulfite reductase (NADPH) flavoprotein alpha-component